MPLQLDQLLSFTRARCKVMLAFHIYTYDQNVFLEKQCSSRSFFCNLILAIKRVLYHAILIQLLIQLLDLCFNINMLFYNLIYFIFTFYQYFILSKFYKREEISFECFGHTYSIF